MRAPFQAALTNLDERWADPDLWGTLKRYPTAGRSPTTPMPWTCGSSDTTQIEPQPEGRQIYLALFLRTLKIAGLVTLICLLLAYPVANLLASVVRATANLLMILVLLPFWTSLLVRTTAWIVLLQKQGVINDLLVWAGIVGDGNRLALIYNQTGTLIAMSHVLLPFMILPIYAVMKSVPPTYMRAAHVAGRVATRGIPARLSAADDAGRRGRRACSCSSWRSATTSRPAWSAATAAR